MEQSRSSFKGSLGFVLAAAGSAVGLGNIWRFPYLAAKDGGGLFLAIYLMLALTFGFAMLTSETAIGRKTKQSPLTAYGKVHKKWGWLGFLASIVPFIIMPYYCVIGGWVLKYFIAFVSGQGKAAASDEYFGTFITDKTQPNVMLIVFILVCAVIIFMGVDKGIERFSKIIMPLLLILVIGIAIYSLTLTKAEDGTVRTGLQGLKILFVPDMHNVSLKQFAITVVDAMGQLFYSLSVAMGIMIAYGSYVRDEDNLVKSINQIEIFDTAVAFLAGIMIIPAVYVFMGKDGLSASGPSLMFVSLPKVFMEMGTIGNVIGALFFAMVLFAAITSAISILEAIVSSIIDKFNASRHVSTIIETILALLIGIAVCRGFDGSSIFFIEAHLPNMAEGTNGQLLDVMDYISNNILMPIVAICTCILIGWVVKTKYVEDEVTKNGEKANRRTLYRVMIKYISPVLLFLLLLMSLGVISF
ncbi:MAG: sodium-dependent transporter [Eubacterium sp.]|nr:sodium-dependent transporter [Eubacterium sp.]